MRQRWGLATIVVAALAVGGWARYPSGPQPQPASLASLPFVPVPEMNPMSDEKIALGRMLFFDARLSGDGSTACASCHLPRYGWSHSDALAPGYPGHRLWRNNPTVLNAAHFKRLMWDGTLDSLEIQARSAMQAPVEGNGKTIDAVFARVGAAVTPMLETNSIISILAHAGSGHWSSVVPRSVLEQVGTPPRVIAIELVEPSVDWATGLVTLAREPQAPMVAALIAEAKALAESFEKSA